MTEIIGIAKPSRRNLIVSGAAVIGGFVSANKAAEASNLEEQIFTVYMIKVKPGMAKEYAKHAIEYVELTRKESGCLVFNIHVNSTDPQSFLRYEGYANKDAQYEHFRSKHKKEYSQKVRSLTESEIPTQLKKLI
jgi:quinol monooxygenase YgiN